MSTRRSLRRVAVTLAVTVLAGPLFAAFAPPSVAESGYPLRTVATVPRPDGPVKSASRQAKVLAVDSAARRMYYLYGDAETPTGAWLATYDISKRIPRQIGPVASMGPSRQYDMATRYTVAVDTKRHQLAILTDTYDVEGHASPIDAPLFHSLIVFSMTQNKIVGRWALPKVFPGFAAGGITYSAADDRYYTAGEFTGVELVNGLATSVGKFLSPGTTIASLDPSNGALAWARTIADVCPNALYSTQIGTLLAHSGPNARVPDSLYVACVSGGSGFGSITYPGTIGLARVHIAPRGTSADQVNQTVEFFAIGGAYSSGGRATGIAAYDALNDRFFLQSLSFTTPGAWVFDGRLTAWVGFVAAPANTDYYIGLNECLGHLYIGTFVAGGGATNGIQVADTRQTPVPNGDISSIATSSLMAADCGSNRLFVRPADANAHWLVLEDVYPVSKPDADIHEDYDALTTSLPDAAPNQVDYALGATGFGAQIVQVGGTSAPLTAGGPATSDTDLAGLSPGTRAVMMSRVGAVDLRPAGASASAQSLVADQNTTSEWQTQDGPDDDEKPDHPHWPWASIVCNDSGGDATAPSTQGSNQNIPGDRSEAHITCNTAKSLASAHSTMSEETVGGTTIAYTSFTVTATRDQKVGAQVVAEAVARGVTFAAGPLSIYVGRVVATSVSRAHGHGGTSYSEWNRSIAGLRVTDSTGSVIPVDPGCASRITVGPKPNERHVTDTCADLAATLNKLVPTHFKAQFPMPELIATPKGAFAGTEQTLAQYLNEQTVNDQGVIYTEDSVGIRPAAAMETEVYTDTAERSRTVAHLASLQTNARFAVSPPFDTGGYVDTGGSTPPVDSGPPVIVPGNPPATTAGNPPVVSQPPPQGPRVFDLRSGFMFLRRSAKDIALLVLLSGLMLGGAGSVFRRRRLVDVLVTVPRKEAL